MDEYEEAILEYAKITRKFHPEFSDLYLYGEGDSERDCTIMAAFMLQSSSCPDCGQLMNIGMIADSTFWFCLKCRETKSCTGMKLKKSKSEEEIVERNRQKLEESSDSE